MSETFRCPRCGGPYFGAILRRLPDGRAEIDHYECHCDRDGNGLRPWPELMRAGIPIGSQRECRWKGPASACMVAPAGKQENP